jgi:hypothetical protein
MALPSEADICRKCGGRLKQGFISGEGPWTQATILWLPATAEDALDPGYVGGNELAPLTFFRLSKDPKFPARLCPTCKLVEFEYP